MMKITFKRTKDILKAAKFTFDNMLPYYQRYAPDWDIEKVVEVTKDLENFDIVLNNESIGVMRLEFKDSYCYLRDLQVSSKHQNKGIGEIALIEAKQCTLNANLNTLKLRVLKISPAITLYKRNGFLIENEDEKFYNMAAEIA